MVPNPTFQYERDLLSQGFSMIVGVDEAGSGSLAGPLVAGAAVIAVDSRMAGLRDSKLMTPAARDEMYAEIVDGGATAWAFGMVSVEEIAALGLRPANLLAMKRAIEGIVGADYALVDAWTIPGLAIPQRGIIHGDRLVKSIAAASIVAKVTRDRMMVELARKFPKYGFEVHKGYATKDHIAAIDLHGPCKIHRMGYATFKK